MLFCGLITREFFIIMQCMDKLCFILSIKKKQGFNFTDPQLCVLFYKCEQVGRNNKDGN